MLLGARLAAVGALVGRSTVSGRARLVQMGTSSVTTYGESIVHNFARDLDR